MSRNIFGNPTDATTIITIPATNSPLLPALGVVRPSARMLVQDAAREALRDELKVRLVHAALQNSAALSQMENALLDIAPRGADRYKAIVDAYAYSAAFRLADF